MSVRYRFQVDFVTDVPINETVNTHRYQMSLKALAGALFQDAPNGVIQIDGADVWNVDLDDGLTEEDEIAADDEDPEGCVFCDPERLPEDRILSSSTDGTACWVFEPLNPVVPGHLLVVPMDHEENATGSPRLTGAAFEVAAREVTERGIEQFNLITSTGAAATQTVRHLHIHIVPRTEDDDLHLPWTGQQKDVNP